MDKILGLLDFLPGYKTNTGAVVLLLTTILQLARVNPPVIGLVKTIAEALFAYGVVMKNLRKN